MICNYNMGSSVLNMIIYIFLKLLQPIIIVDNYYYYNYYFLILKIAVLFAIYVAK